MKKSGTTIQEALHTVGAKVSNTTGRRLLHKLGLHGRRPAKKPFVSLVNRRKRVAWCKAWKTMDFNTVLFTDEKKWVFHLQRQHWVWRAVGKRYHPRNTVTTRQQGGGSLMVWGAISSTKTYPLIMLDGTLSGAAYVDILKKFLPKTPKNSCSRSTVRTSLKTLPWVFQQDNASAHTSRVAEAYLKKRNAVILPWPANSPDLSPIENLWSIVSQKVYNGHKQYRCKEELFEAVQKEWLAIPQSILTSLYDSIPKRMEAVVKAKGFPTKY